MDVIVFKGYYLNKCTNWWLSITAVIAVIVFLMSNFTSENRWVLMCILMFAGLNIVLYLNRLEPKLLKFDDRNFEITYFPQWSFGKKNALYSKYEVKVLQENDKLTLSNDTGVVAKIRKKAINAEDWEAVKNYFG
jgi:hypothetical protein